MSRELALRTIRAWHSTTREPRNHERCAHERCWGNTAAVAVWLSSDWTRVTSAGVCHVHAQLIRHEGWPAILIPRAMWSDQLRDRLFAQASAEVQRRTVPRQPMYTFVGTATGTGGWFGGNTVYVNFG